MTPARNRAPCWGEDGGAGYQMCAHTHTHRSVRSDKGRQGRSLIEAVGCRGHVPGGNPQNWALRAGSSGSSRVPGTRGSSLRGGMKTQHHQTLQGGQSKVPGNGPTRDPHRAPRGPSRRYNGALAGTEHVLYQYKQSDHSPCQQDSQPQTDHGPRQRSSQPQSDHRPRQLTATK